MNLLIEKELKALNSWWKENKILFGEIKWSIKKIGVDIYEDLKRKARMVEWSKSNRKEYFCLFSKSGFTDDMLRLAKKERVYLFHEDRLLR